MTPHEAIVAATATNARILALDDMGTMAAGKDASFVVLDANPLDSILNTRRISIVYLRGKEIDREGMRDKFTRASSGS
jgi:imidazolonepropionase-like amidohydrolase